MPDINELNFEEALEKLQATVKKLESGELSLEQSLACFEDGIKLTKHCQSKLLQAEQKVEILMQNGIQDGKLNIKPFSVDPKDL
ncbi:MAG: exodeoxyribonuclease VII small subunit [Bdellovibrio sp.]|nr:exodeoxyribonuclease VII small subunit [Bdellovibrio sp.]